MSYLKQPPSNNQFVEMFHVKLVKKNWYQKCFIWVVLGKKLKGILFHLKSPSSNMSKLKKKTLSYGLKMTYYGTFTQEIVKVTLKRLRVPQNAKFHIKRKKS